MMIKSGPERLAIVVIGASVISYICYTSSLPGAPPSSIQLFSKLNNFSALFDLLKYILQHNDVLR